MKIKATLIKGKDLKPGDLFSTEGPAYWDYIKANFSIGERVYIRTETPTNADDRETDVFKIEVEQ